MKRVCPVDVTGLVAALHLLDWKPAGEPGTFSWIDRWPTGMPTGVFDIITDLYPGRHQSFTVFSKLVSGQVIEPHYERQDSDCKVRIHIPIVTNPSAIFMEGKLAYHMALGWAWEMDPSMPHSVANGGEADRVHLLFNMAVTPS